MDLCYQYFVKFVLKVENFQTAEKKLKKKKEGYTNENI